MRLEVLEHEFNAAPFPLFTLGEAVTSRWENHLGLNLLAFVMDFRGTNVIWTADLPSWVACADAQFERIANDRRWFFTVRRNVEKTVRALHDHVAGWDVEDFSKWPDEKLSHGYTEFLNCLRDTFEWGVLLSISDFNPPRLTLHLQEISKKRFGAKANEAFTILTTNVEELSYQKEEELDFLRILSLPDKDPEKALENHARKYGFLSYGYRGPLTWTAEYFQDLLKAARKQGIDAKSKLEKHDSDTKTLRERIKSLETKLTQQEREWFEVGRTLVFLKPWRKDSQIRTYPLAERLLREISRRIGVPLEGLRFLSEKEVVEALSRRKTEAPWAERKKRCFVIARDGANEYFAGKEADAWSEKVVPEAIVTGDSVSGTPATVGFAKGTVRIVNTSEDIAKMHPGDILVSVATNPLLMPAIRKAAAIVTDQGGLTCHAAIVSREFGIPCVVGTKVATRLFKDGDFLEVDAHSGLVKKVYSKTGK